MGLIGDVVGVFILPTAWNESLTLFFYVCEVYFLRKTMSKTCLFKIGQYHHALLNIPKEA